MKYWKNGFYEEQSENSDRVEITDDYWLELLNGQGGEKEIFTNANGLPALRSIIITKEQELSTLRKKREKECFSIINRGQIWYDTLNESQILQLKNWYNEWLNATKTNIIPSKPIWIKD